MTDRMHELPADGSPDFEALVLSHADDELFGEEEELAEALLERSPDARALFDLTLDQRDTLFAAFDAVARQLPDVPLEAAMTGAVTVAGPSPRSLGGAQRHGALDPDRPAKSPTPAKQGRARRRTWPFVLSGVLGAGFGFWAAPYVAPPPAPSAVVGAETIPRPSPAAPPVQGQAAPVPDDWRWRLAAAHGVLVPGTFASAPVAAEATAATLAALSPIFGVDLAGLSAPEGVLLKRVQLLELDDGPVGELGFVAEGGGVVTLYVRHRADGGGLAALEPERRTLLDQQVAEWRGTANTYVLMGPASALDSYAAELAAQLR